MLSNEKGLFKEAKKAHFLLPVLLAPFMVIVFIILGGVISRPFHYIKLNDLEWLKGSYNLIIGFGSILLLLFLWVKFIEKRKISSLGLTKNNPIKNFLKGYFLGIILITVVVFVLLITRQIEFNKLYGISITKNVVLTLIFIIPAWIIQGGTEELLTRGWLMHVVGAKSNVITGIIISSTLFGVLHILNDHVTFISIINIVIVGVFAALYVMNKGNLWGVCGWHASWNFFQGHIFGLNVSGSTIENSVMKFSNNHHSILNGGLFGPEAGIVTTFIYLILIFYMLPKVIKNYKR